MTLTQELRVPFELEGEASYGQPRVAGIEDAPAIRAVDEIFESAIAARATDIHIEPLAEGGRVRERVDGVLCESRRLSSALHERVLSRIKLLSGMDIADRRLPQDGRYAAHRKGRTVEARISSMPTVFGEKLAVRLLDVHAQVPSLEALGMPADLAKRYRELIHAPSGFVIVCGPTGSGKTTTLYAALAERNVEAQNLCSVEDPVEMRLPGVAQSQVNVRAGLTFAAAFRAFLRQDPNAIMIGEMRDAETAEVAFSAALCGQLVLTTLHSNDALSAFDRLAELGVSWRTMAGAVSGVVSQRLVRQLCTYCKRSAPAAATVVGLDIPVGTILAEPVGCERCRGTGYHGLSAMFELAHVSPALRRVIEARAPLSTRREVAMRAGYEPLIAGAVKLLRRGETGIEEVTRLFGGRSER